MAHKRMFSKDVTGSDAFREMPASSQALYFHLGMEADDDGFLDNYKNLMRGVNSSDDDLKILLSKRFLIIFPSKIIVVKHWKINNTVQKDRYHETKYLDEKRALIVKENGAYTECIQPVSIMDTQNRIGEDRIDSEIGISQVSQKEEKEDESEFVDDITIQEEDGDGNPIKQKGPGNAIYEKALKWAEKRTGRKILGRVKQYAVLKKAYAAGITEGQLIARWKELEVKQFYIDNGLDWCMVVSSFDRK